SEDSVAAQLWPEGTTKEDAVNDPNLLRWVLAQIISGLSGVSLPTMDDDYIAGQGEKAILAPVGLIKVNGIPIAPAILPVQLIRIGSLIIIAHPGEITTMSGRRLRKSVLDELSGAGVDHAVVASYAGAFSSYTATREEYAEQHYEGASTLYGPWTLEAFQQENKKLAVAMRDGLDVEPGPEPPDLSDRVVGPPLKVLFDGLPLSKKFGDVRKPPLPSYQPGEKVEVCFYGAHPINDLRLEGSYLQVERLQGSLWETAYADRDSCTYFRWRRVGIGGSEVTVEWLIPDNQPAGDYRIRYNGHWKSFWTGEIKEFTGISGVFTVT
ncbi:MAG: neutral/alkaline non-lysosomal ceramidase C-terminal domain-containing protein, partial [Candidatus Aminicenantales bacterium]